MDLERPEYESVILYALDHNIFNDAHAQLIHEYIKSKYDISKFISFIESIYDGNEKPSDKTAILNVKSEFTDHSLESRIEKFLSTNPMDILDNLEFADQLYGTLFNTEIKNNKFWYTTIKNGYCRKYFIIDMINYAKSINGHKIEILNDLEQQLINRISTNNYAGENKKYRP